LSVRGFLLLSWKPLYKPGLRYVEAQVNLGAVEHFIRVVGEKEDAIFQRRMRMLQRDKRRREQDKVGSPPEGIKPLDIMLSLNIIPPE
jgi:hypothetical protein